MTTSATPMLPRDDAASAPHDPSAGSGLVAARAQLGRRAGAPRAAGGRGPLMRRFLAVPLLWKLVGANALVLLAALVSVKLAHAWHTAGASTILLGALVLSFVANLLLVRLALRPLDMLETTARKVWHGDLEARVPVLPTADRDMTRVANTFNLLLDGLVEDRARMRLLASQVISAQDAERARISRELHDSTAQTLAAAKLQLQAAQQAGTDPETAARLETLRELVSTALEETRILSHLLYPRVLDDLGLVPALEWLARQARTSSGGTLAVDVESDVVGVSVPPTAASVLYRVAQEGLRNAMTHAQASTVTLRLEADDARATIEVVDDGRGFDVAEAEARRPGMGLFAVRERVALVGGSVDFYSVPGRGTRVSATIPLHGAPTGGRPTHGDSR